MTDFSPEDQYRLDVLSLINGQVDQRNIINLEIRANVQYAVRVGASWQQIADVLGVTRQAAWHKYHEPPESEPKRFARVVGEELLPGLLAQAPTLLL